MIRIRSLATAALLCPLALQAQDAPDAATRRADALVAQLTTEERLRLVHGYFPPMSKDRPADMIPSAGYVPGVPRLGIPTLRESDASLGVANQVEQRKGDVATALPASLALAASFDPDLAYRSGAMIGAEARAKTFNVLLAGGVNLTREAEAPRPVLPGLVELAETEKSRRAGGKYDMTIPDPAITVRYDVGAAVGYRSYLKHSVTPLFPFGHGLSYTQFRYSGLKITDGRTLSVAFDVTNSGKVAGADVAEVYATAGRRDGSTVRLVGFERVHLRPGETRRVSVTVDPRFIADYDPAQPGWHVAAGRYPVAVGHFAGHAVLSGVVILNDRKERP